MKILFANDVPVGLLGTGGAEGYLLQVGDALTEAGHRVVILTRQQIGEPEAHEGNRYLVPHFDSPPLRKRVWKGVIDQRRALQRVRAIVEQEDPDVIHVNNLLEPRALHVLRTLRPVVKSIHDCRPFCAKPSPSVASRFVGDSDDLCDLTLGARCWRRCYLAAGRTLRDRLEAWTYFPRNLMALREVAACDRLVVYSRYLRDLALRCVRDPAKVELVYHFTDAESLVPPKARTAGAETVFLFVGRLVREKGVGLLLSALSRLSGERWRLIVAGDGPLREELVRQAQVAGLASRVSWAGFLSRAEVFRQYAAADVVVFPSIWAEGFGLTGIEAMYAGRPVIAFDTGGVNEWCVNGETGVLLPRGDVAALADAMRALARDARRREELGRHAREYVQRKFRKKGHIERLVSIYSAVAVRGRAGAARRGEDIQAAP